MWKMCLSVAVTILSVTALTGCDSKALVFGPYPVTVPLGEGTIDPEAFGNVKTVTPVPVGLTMDFASVPTEDDLAQALNAAIGAKYSSFMKVREVGLDHITLTAQGGDFSTAYVISLWYVPKPLAGVSQLPVELGTAFSIAGFGGEIELKPASDVDFLELIRANDANPAEGNPQLQVLLLAMPPNQTTAWRAEAELHVYVGLGGA